MSEEKMVSDQPVQDGGAVQQEIKPTVSDSQSDTVKYDTYKRTLSEAKKAKAQLQEYQTRLTELEQQQLAAEGKKDELISSLQKRVSELDGKYKSAVGSFAEGKALDAIVDEAVKSGCSSTGLLRKVVADKVSELEFDEQFNPNKEQVRMMIEEIRKTEPILFGKPAPAVAAHNLNPVSVEKTGPVDPSAMTADELKQKIIEIDSQIKK